jgi:hypothetical protein
MARAAARSGPSSKRLECGRSGSDGSVFFIAGILPEKGEIGKALAHGHYFELKSVGELQMVSVLRGEVAEWFNAHAWKA